MTSMSPMRTTDAAAASTSAVWLQIRGLARRFGATPVLEDVTLGVNQGEVICLVGPSGCGKSTLLRLIAGVDRPDAGQILLQGQELSGPQAFIEPEDRAIGFMFQDYALFPHLSVTQNILFGLRKRPKARARALCEAVIGRLGIAHLAGRHPHMLSGGEQQRVALARALAPQPRILLMDEPFSNLDRNLREDIRHQTLAVLRELGTTALMVTHDPEEALCAGDRVALIRGGRIVQYGPAHEIYDHPADAYAAGFFGSCNRFAGHCRGGKVDTPLGHFPAPGVTEGAPVTVLVRPHALAVGTACGPRTAQVTQITLMGEIEQIAVQLPGWPGALQLRATTRRKLRIGDNIGLSPDPSGVFVFASGE